KKFIQRDREIYWLRKLSETGYGARMLATFANGRFEEFLDADTLTKRDLRDPQVSALIASKVCQLHNLADQFPLSPGIERDRSAAPELWDSIGRYVTQVSDAMDAILETYPDRKARAEALGLNGRLTAALARIKQRLESLGSPVVFAHNDLQYGNLLRHSITREIVIVDYEYSSFNYRSYDIANHFCEWMADYHGDAPHVLAAAQFPTLAERQHFYRAYIEAHHVNACVNAFDAEVMVSVLLSHAFWGLWGLVREADMLGRREIDFDFWEYGAQRIERLWADMETALAMQC
ncbi:kinase-like domain-containing protein, partial [Blastocladiella britannica]